LLSREAPWRVFANTGHSYAVVNLLRCERPSLHIGVAMWRMPCPSHVVRRCFMYYLGIDWANDKHDLCLLDAEGKIIRELECVCKLQT